jgi:hypothetical protein
MVLHLRPNNDPVRDCEALIRLWGLIWKVR